MVDSYPDYTLYPFMKFHQCGYESIEKNTHHIMELLPQDVVFRNNEILNIYPDENLLLGICSLRLTYENLIHASGLEADYSKVDGKIFFK